jgi:phage shock protein PspC (stress-responsive transcriptional regulator)
MAKRLYRSETDKKIAGVCGGIAEYTNIDATLVRAVFILLTLAGGPGVLLYLVLMFIMPKEPFGKLKNDQI